MVPDLDVKLAAELLRVSEATLVRWVRQGVIPAHRVTGEPRFDRGELESWARRNRIGSRALPDLAPGQEEGAHLLRAVQHGGVFHGIGGATPAAVYREIVKVFPYPADAEDPRREALYASLMERETLMTTAVGHGIALPHPRHPADWGLGEPVVGVFLLREPVDFGAIDHEDVTVLFVILCRTIKGHLRMLSQVSHFVNDPAVRAFLGTRPAADALFQRIDDAFGSH